jgi:hypothetical protein
VKNGCQIDHWLHASRGALATIALFAAFFDDTIAQIQPTIKVRVNVSPAINVSRMEQNTQLSLGEEMSNLTQLVPRQPGSKETTSIGPGFAISAYENISILLTVERPSLSGGQEFAAKAPKITWGYLNDGTTYFRRATITNKSSVEFRLRNNNLLRQSMKFRNPLLTAYVFLIINERKEASAHENPVPVSTVTIEFL